MIPNIEKALSQAQVIFFTMTIDSELTESKFCASNSYFTKEMKSQMGKLGAGDSIIFENIISLTAESKYLDIPNLHFEIA
ncbi:MAG: hypothetical protein HRT72_06690 [Flavobacteriales bacterium]|nr:hypothetical protein [Flavobacteriales bacterium]